MTESIKVLVVDDERLARLELIRLLLKHPEVQIVGEADSVSSAIERIEAFAPDLVFLDIQMPEESGFALFEKITVDFAVVFVTAFDNYAIRAFEVNALDYLLKPVNPTRLAQTLERVKTNLTVSATNQNKQIYSYEDYLFVKSKEKPEFLKISSIVYITATGSYTHIYTGGKEKVVIKPLKEWEDLLPPQHFLRIHRTYIINLNYIEKIEPWFNNSYQVYLKTVKTPIITSRRYAGKLRERAI